MELAFYCPLSNYARLWERVRTVGRYSEKRGRIWVCGVQSRYISLDFWEPSMSPLRA